MSPETADATAEFLAQQNQGNGDEPPAEPAASASEPEKPVEEPAEEPEKTPTEEPKEPEKKEPEEPEEAAGILPTEDLKAIYAKYDEEVVDEPPQPAYQPLAGQPPSPIQPPPQQQQQQAPAIPQDILNITPHGFMPEGQEFDPMDMHTPGSPSNIAAMKAQQEQTRRFHAVERERYEQEQVARQGAKAIDKLNARMEREKWPKALRQKFWNTSPSNPNMLDMVADGFLLLERKALRKAQTARKPVVEGESPPPVNKASRVSQPPTSPDKIKKQVSEDFGGY